MMDKLVRIALAVLLAGFLLAPPAAAQKVEYYHLDALGSVRAVTDENGDVIERHDYLPFGDEWKPTPESQPRKFTGKERDEETGLDYFGARYYRASLARFTSIDPAMTFTENRTDPQRWNRYAYVRNNPVRYVDPEGRVIDTVLDIGFVGWDLFDIGRSVYRGEGVSGTQWLALGGDVVGAAIPFATGVGAAIRAGSKVEHAVETARAGEALIQANRARGMESEARVLRELGEAKSTEKIFGREGASIPDYANRTTLGEVKDTQRVTNSRQLRIQREAAASSGREHVVHTGTNTKVSRRVEVGPTRVERRDDLGPR